ncbi:MAG: hypothetical protein H8E34_06235 [Bacteroidetes bacterium]|nr:hypothetical protein [Bacteroidota bacterium]MBL6944712.1 hypothetical protein [Bacteroidales bacterium]
MKYSSVIIKQNAAIGLIISTLFIISSCSIKGYKPITNSEKSKIPAPRIFDEYFNKALYKTCMNIYGKSITGLTLIKKTDSSYRVVSMSELGMKYFDFEFLLDKHKTTRVHYIMEPLNRTPLINLLKRDFGLLLFLPEISESHIMISDDDNARMIVLRNNHVYFFNAHGNINKITKRRWPLQMKSMINVSGYKQNIPNTINIDDAMVSIEFELIDL